MPPSSSDAARPAGRAAAAALAVAACAIVTTEYLIVGLLPGLAHDLGISVALAGQLVTLFALVVALGGPPLTALLSHVDRRRLFVAIALLFAGANALAALAPNVWVLAVARGVPALALPVFWGTASDTAARLAGPARAGRAVAQVYLGISAALLFGIPLGTLASQAVGWRGAFGLLAALSLMVALLLAWSMPTLAPAPRVRLAVQAALLRDRRFMAQVALSVAVFTAMFAAYTYLADLLERGAGVDRRWVGWWLMGFGAVGLAGNAWGGRLVERAPLATTAAFTLLMGLAMALCMPAAGSRYALVPDLALWGVAYTALFPICQVRVMGAAPPHAKALAGTLNVSAANAGIAIGAGLGGWGIQRWGVGGLGYLAAVLAALAAAAAAAMAWRRRAG